MLELQTVIEWCEYIWILKGIKLDDNDFHAQSGLLSFNFLILLYL